MQETPLMWTARGNVPIDSLRYEKHWLTEQKDDGDTLLWFHEFWYFDDGTLAKNNAHGYLLESGKSRDVTVGLAGIGMGGEQAAM